MPEMQDASSSSLDILIVGAGLSGLSAAISCALAGHRVRVVEAAKELAEVGAGLQITPNGGKLFQQWGIRDILEPKAAAPTFLQIRRYSDGKVLAREDSFDHEMSSKYHGPFWDIHRVDLQRAMSGRARELGVEVRLDSKMVSIDFDRSSLKLHTGEELQADLLVGADGLWSACRESFLASKGLEDSPLPTGDLAYRIVLKLDEVNDQELKDWISKPSCQFWIGPGAHVVAYSLRNGQMFNIVLLVPDNLPSDVRRQHGSLEEMRAIFQDWDPTLNRFLDQVKSVDKWKLMHRTELEHWVNDRSNFVFVGDACHAMLPYLAQGANVSLEDGAVLGNVLAAVQSKTQLPRALKLYEQLRKERGEIIARETFAQRNAFHMLDGKEQEERDALMLSLLGKKIDSKFPARLLDPEFQPWLFGYDAARETAIALQSWSMDEPGAAS